MSCLKRTTPLIVLLCCIVLVLTSCANSEDKAAANAVDNMIISIGEVSYSDDTLKSIEQAKKEYDALSDVQKKLVKQLDALTNAENTYNTLKENYLNECAEKVDKAIESIGEVTLSDSVKSKIKAAINTYDMLDPEAKNRVKKYDVLESSKSKYESLAIENAINLINNIGIVTNDIDTESRINAAVEATKMLIDESNTNKITNYGVIAQAKTNLQWLKTLEKAIAVIRIRNAWSSSPNSAGGVEVHILATNLSEKTVKYITYGVKLLNSVEDTITKGTGIHGEIQYCKATGPIYPGGDHGDDIYWGKFYDYTITHIKLVSIQIEYTDGTTYTINDESIVANLIY